VDPTTSSTLRYFHSRLILWSQSDALAGSIPDIAEREEVRFHIVVNDHNPRLRPTLGRKLLEAQPTTVCVRNEEVVTGMKSDRQP
jgi:hypothetical protein